MPSLGMFTFSPNEIKIPGYVKFNEKLAKQCAYVCRFYGVEFFYFTPADINFNKKKIRGKVFNGDIWVERMFDYPDMIFDRIRKTKRLENKKKIYEELKGCIFNYNLKKGFKGKMGVNYLFEDENFIIPSEYVDSIADVKMFMEKYGKIIVKPTNLNGAIGVYSIEKDGDLFIVGGRSTIEEFTEKEFDIFMENTMKLEKYPFASQVERPYMAQKFITCFTKEGSPYDIRVAAVKNGKNEWEIVNISPKIGVNGGEVVSIGGYGGSYGRWKGFIQHNFSYKEFKFIDKKVKDISLNICNKIENYNGNNITEVGIDLIIDEYKRIYLLEVNLTPGIVDYHFELVENHVKYLLYLYKEGGKNG